MSYCYQPSWNVDYGWRLQHARAMQLSRSRAQGGPRVADESWAATRIVVATVAQAKSHRVGKRSRAPSRTMPARAAGTKWSIGRRTTS